MMNQGHSYNQAIRVPAQNSSNPQTQGVSVGGAVYYPQNYTPNLGMSSQPQGFAMYADTASGQSSFPVGQMVYEGQSSFPMAGHVTYQSQQQDFNQGLLKSGFANEPQGGNRNQRSSSGRGQRYGQRYNTNRNQRRGPSNVESSPVQQKSRPSSGQTPRAEGRPAEQFNDKRRQKPAGSPMPRNKDSSDRKQNSTHGNAGSSAGNQDLATSLLNAKGNASGEKRGSRYSGRKTDGRGFVNYENDSSESSAKSNPRVKDQSERNLSSKKRPAKAVSMKTNGERPAKAVSIKTNGERPAKAVSIKTNGERPAKAVSIKTNGERPAKAVSMKTNGEDPTLRPSTSSASNNSASVDPMSAILAEVDKFSHRKPKQGTHPVSRRQTDSPKHGHSNSKVTNQSFPGGFRGTDRKNQPMRRDTRGKGQMTQPEDDETQRGTLIEQLRSASYECMVCYEIVRCEAAVWSCTNCYHIYHLYCIKKWARSNTSQVVDLEGAWRCPSCQHVTTKFPSQYRCFCGKARDPQYSHYETPHSCGEVCRKKKGDNCSHPCTMLCHPGPCPPCQIMVRRQCRCGATKKSVLCGHAVEQCCGEVCSKYLNCGKHKCAGICHAPPCGQCEVEIIQNCFCGAAERTVICGSEESLYTSFSCEKVCNKTLGCGNHTCSRPCHDGPCETCLLLPEFMTHCPCGKTILSETSMPGCDRKSCTDPVPTCDKTCGKTLKCGPEARPHTCDKPCHQGDCPPCDDTTGTPITCRCGSLVKEFPCSEAVLFTDAQPFLCERRCHKKRHCGKHKCNQLCCVEKEHNCDQVCGRKLTCGLHKCEEPCHRGNCPPCWHVSFEELSCHCGAEILFPPIPCGTKPPECNKLCQRQHSCQHPVLHSCHSDDQCPPCAVLTRKWCMGGHELRNSIPCHRSDISCGLPCNKPLPCTQHVCKRVCHKGGCLQEGEACSQPCSKPRPDCSHPCGAPCHVGQECPKFPCKSEMTLKCKCGNRTGKAVCLMGSTPSQEFNRVTAISLASKMQELQLGQSVDIGDLVKSKKSGSSERRLECNEQCGIIERNRRAALALEIKNPDLSGKLGTPSYPTFLKDMAKQNPSLVASIEKALSDLVKSAMHTKQKSRSYAFAAMNRDQRRTVHELGEFYGCETQSYDNEPARNVVATAIRDNCWLPSVSLTTAVQREVCPKAPPPLPHGRDENKVRAALQALQQGTDVLTTAEKERGKLHKAEKYFDYFDMTD